MRPEVIYNKTQSLPVKGEIRLPGGQTAHFMRPGRFGSVKHRPKTGENVFIVYQAQQEQAKQEYPDGPASIRWQKTPDGETTYFLHIGPNSDVVVAKSSYKDDLLAFAKRHGWELPKNR